MFRLLIFVVSVIGLPLGSAPGIAADLELKVECLCVSEGEGKAEGMTTRDRDTAQLESIGESERIVLLVPTETPGETHKKACDKLTEKYEVKNDPYLPSAEPVKVLLDEFAEIIPEPPYKTTFAGFLQQ
jgi:hypothetical protein